MQRLATLTAFLCSATVGASALAADRTAIDLSAGYSHNCAVTSCGEVECWGRDDWGQAAGRVPTIPPYILGTPVVPEYREVSVGQYHSCALDEHGNVDCWGRANYGQSSDRVGPFRSMDAGWNHNCAVLESNGQIECWGADVHGASSSVPTGAFESVSAGLDFACAIRTGGTSLECWGNDSYGQAPAFLEPPNVEAQEVFTSVSAGSYHACATTDWNGGSSMYCWGYAPYAGLSGYAVELEDGLYWDGSSMYNLGQADAGVWGTFFTRRSGGAEQAYGHGWPFGSTPAPSFAVDQVALGGSHWCVIDDVGEVVCAGSNAHGRADAPDLGGTCNGGWSWPSWPWG